MKDYWHEVNRRIVLPLSLEERDVFQQRFATTEPYGKLYKWADEFYRNYDAFRRNSQDLLSQIDQLRGGLAFVDGVPHGLVDLLRDRGLRYQHALESTQYLVNFLGSVHFMKDATCRLVRTQIAHPKLTPEYDKEVQERIVNNPHAIFLKKLANFQHRALPHFASSMAVRPEGGGLWIDGADLVLSKPNLLEGEWSKEQKTTIEELSNGTDYISIRDLVEDYRALQRDFTIWLMLRFTEYYRQEFEEMNEVVKQIRAGSGHNN